MFKTSLLVIVFLIQSLQDCKNEQGAQEWNSSFDGVPTHNAIRLNPTMHQANWKH